MSTKLLIEGQSGHAGKPDRSLLQLIALARQLNDLVMSGNGKPIQDLAAVAGPSRSYFTRVFRLSFLVPDITKAIVQGHQPVEFSAIKLMRAGQFPLLWPDQRREFEFDRTRSRHSVPVHLPPNFDGGSPIHEPRSVRPCIGTISGRAPSTDGSQLIL